MDGISLSWRLLPESLIDRHGLRERMIARAEGAEQEVRFLLRDMRPILPVWIGNELRIVPWGNHDRTSRLPRSGIVAREIIESGQWSDLRPELVDIPASFGFDRGVWFRIREGVKGIAVENETGRPVVYLLTIASSHYYQIMTRNNRMPVLIGEQI